MQKITRTIIAALVIGGFSLPVQADEIEESLQMALEAYQAGDIKAAKEEIDFAAQLIAQMKAAGLTAFLPEPMEGWTREDDDQGSGMMGFGGGMSAGARYIRDGEDVEIQLMAENQMVASMAVMFNNAAIMGSMGQVKRIKRQKVVVTPDGELQALIDSRILVQISGSAPIEEKEAYFGALDFRGLGDF
jgi:hypothetical protein